MCIVPAPAGMVDLNTPGHSRLQTSFQQSEFISFDVIRETNSEHDERYYQNEHPEKYPEDGHGPIS